MDVKSGKTNLFIQAQQATSSEEKITAEKKTAAPVAPIVSVIAEKTAPVRSGATTKTEIQLSASATQAQLSNRLAQTLKTDFAQKKTNNPVLQNATADHSGEVRGSKKWEFFPHFPFIKFKFTRDFNDKNVKHNIPKTLSTGNGDDKVDIQMGGDGRVHVKVNDKEAWSGTPEQFKYLTIDTGSGMDVVNNSVEGATINTGEGNDTVNNNASGTNIDTGRGDDDVFSIGGRNIIGTGSGKDVVVSTGDLNQIRTGDGDDIVQTNGQDNKVWTGLGLDSIVGSGDNNILSTGGDEDYVKFQGHNNDVWAGSGYDEIDVAGNRNRIHGQEGVDTISLNGSNNAIDAGLGDDRINVQGNLNLIQGSDGDDTIRSKGDENKIYGGAGADTIFNAGNKNMINPGAGRDKVIEASPWPGTDASQVATNTTFEASEEEIREELSPFGDPFKP